jgi:hypothetical protein
MLSCARVTFPRKSGWVVMWQRMATVVGSGDNDCWQSHEILESRNRPASSRSSAEGWGTKVVRISREILGQEMKV